MTTYGDAVLDGFRALPTPAVSDALQQLGVQGTMEAEISQVVVGKVVGPAVTVLEEPEESAGPPTHALEAIDSADPGSVIVIGIGGARDVAVWGGLMTAGATARGLAGVVLDGSVRDVDEIERDYGLPVYSRGTSPRSTVGSYRTVARGVPVDCGGVRVQPGDLVVADRDGVVIVPADLAERTLELAHQIEEGEQRTAERIRALGSIGAAVAETNRV